MGQPLKVFKPHDVEELGNNLEQIDLSLEKIFPDNDQVSQYCKNSAKSEIRRSILYWANENKRIQNDNSTIKGN